MNGTSATGVSGVDVVAYPGDVLGTGLPNATDASLVDQVGSGSGSGFSVFKDLDPVIIGGVGGGSLFVNANDASLIDEAASGATVTQIPSIPVGVSLTFGGPDPYLYLSPVQGSPGQTVTETLYLDVTDPHGIQLTALDEAIGFDASALQISDVRGTNALAALGSYETASTVDNGSGKFLVAQAFMGTGLPPVVPYGTDIPVLQFNVTLNTDMGVGSETGLTLLQYGTVNNVTQYTAISDNEGALTWTPGKAPSNSGNVAIDGSVMVVPASASVVPEVEAPVTSRPVVVQPRVIAPVRRVIPVIGVTSVASPAVNQIGVGEASVSLVVPLVSNVASTAVEGPAVITMGLLQSVATTVQPGTATIGVAAAVAPTEIVPTASILPSPGRSADSGASLSLVAVGTNKLVPTTATGTASVKASTSALDEMYRLLGTPLMNGNAGVAGGDTMEELIDSWDLESLVLGMASGDNSDERILE